MSIMGFMIVILIFIVGIGLVNEKWIHLQSDIALVFFSLIIGVVLLLVDMLVPGNPSQDLCTRLPVLSSRHICWIRYYVLCCLREPAR